MNDVLKLLLVGIPKKVADIFTWFVKRIFKANPLGILTLVIGLGIFITFSGLFYGHGLSDHLNALLVLLLTVLVFKFLTGGKFGPFR